MTDGATEGSMIVFSFLKQNHVSMHLTPKFIINRKNPNVLLKC